MATAISAPVIDGNMSDWATYLSDADNNSYDNTNAIDLDWPISDAGSDLTRLTFTEDANNLFLYIERAGSSNNKVDIIFYADINNDGMMELNEPVIHLDWSGSNGTVHASSLNYIPSAVSILNNITSNLDGSDLGGTLLSRSSIGETGKGSADGRSMEVKIPFASLTRLNATGIVINQLSFGQEFKFHMSTINGNISSIPNPNSINDNFGGCLAAPTFILRVKLVSFSAMLTTDKVDLKWTTSSEKNVSHFTIEKSTDGINFSETGVVFAFGNTSETKNYSFTDGSINASQAGVIYYRLRSVDIDGKSELSQVKTIRIGKKNEQSISILIYPNPVGTELRVTIPTTWQGKKVSYELLNSNGQVMLRNITSTGSQTESMNVNSIAPGFYIIKVTCNGETAQQKIIKR